MTVKIKICGLKNERDVERINLLPVDYVGFVFAKSKRQVDQKTARSMRQQLRTGIEAVGVFVDESIEVIDAMVLDCELDIVQLHGDETDDMIRKIGVPVWKALPIKDAKSTEQIHRYPHAAGFVLDTHHARQRGGTGVSFDWHAVADVSKTHHIILAGGLDASNVSKAMDIVQPHVVDVSSSVETDGSKDPNKIQKFIQAVKAYAC